MGFDLTARRPKRGATQYFRADISTMCVLRSAMRAAGVPEQLVYKKFVSNDGFLVTQRQSQVIGEKLTAWVKGRNLTLSVAEASPAARASLSSLAYVLGAIDKRRARLRTPRSPGTRNLVVPLDRRARKDIREFASFCTTSGGFWVD